MPGPSCTESRCAPTTTVCPAPAAGVSQEIVEGLHPPALPRPSRPKGERLPHRFIPCRAQLLLDVASGFLISGGPGGPVAAIGVGHALQRLRVLPAIFRDLKSSSTVRASTELTGSNRDAVHPESRRLIATTTAAAAALPRLCNRLPVTV